MAPVMPAPMIEIFGIEPPIADAAVILSDTGVRRRPDAKKRTSASKVHDESPVILDGTNQLSWSSRKRVAWMAAAAPMPAEVTTWRKCGSAASPAANTPAFDVCMRSSTFK